MYVEDVTGALKIKHVRALLERDLKSHNATFLVLKNPKDSPTRRLESGQQDAVKAQKHK